MAIEPEALSNPLQPRFESISMRLDAATDTLLQTRDLLIRHLEHQMLQLDEVRKALHDASKEATQWAQEVSSQRSKGPIATSPPLQPAAEAEREFTLESLFAPLNAAPPRPTASTPIHAESQTSAVEPLVHERVSATARVEPPSPPPQQAMPPLGTPLPPRREPQVIEMDVMPPTPQPPPSPILTQPEVHQLLFDQDPSRSSTVPSPTSLRDIATALTASDNSDPLLEKATLEELNDALARAFSQIAARHHQG